MHRRRRCVPSGVSLRTEAVGSRLRAGPCRVNRSRFGRSARTLRGVERRERARALRALADDYSACAARAQALGLGPLADDTREAEAWLRASAGELRRAGRRFRAPRRAGRVA